MSRWRDKGEAAFNELRSPGEQVLYRGDGVVNLSREAFFVITDRRVYFFWMGATKLSEPKQAVIELKYITTVNCISPGMMQPPELTIHSRTGAFTIKLIRQAKKEAGLWASRILEAQEAVSQA